jgi:aminoglycoside 6'-N-acetyltransferase
MDHTITFKLLTEDDFTLLHAWMNLDFVQRWYGKRKFVYDDVEKEYSMRIKQDTPVEGYIVQYNGYSIGYAQYYPIHDYPNYAACVDVPTGTFGIDIFIGDKQYVHQQLGSSVIDLFLKQVVFSVKGCTSCVVGTEADNPSAIRAYEKAGFSYLKTVQCRGQETPEYLMERKNIPQTQVLFSRET